MGDAWYFPQRHDLFTYDTDEKTPLERNLDLLSYNPDPSDPTYNIDYTLPSFNCISVRSRKTADVPNGGCNPCDDGCWQDHPYGGDPFSGCAGSPRVVAITPSHAIGVNHYKPGVGAALKFFGDQGNNFQYSIVVDVQPIGLPSPTQGSNELRLLTLKSAPENVSNPCSEITYPECIDCEECMNEFTTVLGDPLLAPNVDIKFPRFLPMIAIRDPLTDLIRQQTCFFIDQDFRCGVGTVTSRVPGIASGSSLCSASIVTSHKKEEDVDWEFWSNLLASGTATIGDLVGQMASGQGVMGDSSSPFFINIPSLTEKNGPPILGGLMSGGEHLINQVDRIIGMIKEYDSENGTNYAEELFNRIIKRSDLGLLELDFQVEPQDKKVGLIEIDLSDIWKDKDTLQHDDEPGEGLSCISMAENYKTGLASMLTKDHGFIIDFYFSRVISFNYNENYELSWTEEQWGDAPIFNIPEVGFEQRHCNFTIFNDEVYVCNARGAIYDADIYPDTNPGLIAKFKINQDKTVSPDGFLFEVNNNPEPFMGTAIASNSRELFVGARNVITNTYYYPDPAIVVFLREGNSWIYKQTIPTPNPFDGMLDSDMFGHTVACDDTWLLASDKSGLSPESSDDMRLYVYKKDENGMWDLHQTIDQPIENLTYNDSEDYGFGHEIEIHNNMIVISGDNYQGENIGEDYGSAFIYVLNSANNQFELSKEINFDYNKEFYEYRKNNSPNQNAWLSLPPEFSKSITLNENFLAISAPLATDDRRFSFEDLSEDQWFTPSGVISLYEISQNKKDVTLIANLDKYSGIGQRFGTFVAVSPQSYDEYGREKGRSILSLEEITSIEDISKTFSGGKLIVQDFQYNTFPIDKSNSNLGGLGQSFNVKLTETYTKIIQYINTSTSPNGIVAMPLGIHPAYSAIFEKYTKIVSSNNKPIHFLIQEEINDLDTVYLRDVLEKMLANKEGSLYGSNKSDILNEMSNKELIIGVFNNEDEENTADAQFLTGEFNVNIAIINKNEIKINKLLPSNATIGMLSEQIYKYGILSKNPSMASALAVARAHAHIAPLGACCREWNTGDCCFCSVMNKETCDSSTTGIYLGDDTTCESDPCLDPEISDHETHILFTTDLTDEEEKNIRYLRLGVEVYYGMWEHDPNGDGTSGANEYRITSRSQMQSEDPDLYSVINGFFPEDITIYY